MNTLQRSVLTTLAEAWTLEEISELKIPHGRLLLASGIRSTQAEVLSTTLSELQEQYEVIETWELCCGIYHIQIARDFPRVSSSAVDKEIIWRRQVRRALLFKLYDIYCERQDRYFAYPLVEAAPELQVSKEEIREQVQSLQDEYYLEYRLCDGGACTSSLTAGGIGGRARLS